MWTSGCVARLAVVGIGLVGAQTAQQPPARADGPAASAPDESREHLALLVGVADYPDGGGFPDLRGAVNDTLALRDVLVERFGFRDEDVLLLHDSRATHEAIVRAFTEHLLRRAGPRTEAVFFFSGHGSRVRDASGKEPDGLDSTYLAFDSRAGKRNGSHDLCDDELFSLVAALCAKTPFVTVIADSCHAGGGLRAREDERQKWVAAGAEPLDREWVKSFWPEDVPLLDDDAPPLPADRHLHVAACRRDQVALEKDVPGPEGELVPRGVLTLYLVQALEGAQPGESWRSLLGTCRLAVMSASPAQSVSVDGEDERLLFGAGFRRLEGFVATLLSGRDGVSIELTIPHGLGLGSELAIRDRLGERTFGKVAIDAMNAAFARGRWIGAVPANLPAGALRAVETAPPSKLSPLRVSCGQDVRALVAGAGGAWVEVVDEGARADAELVLEGFKLLLQTDEGIPLLGSPLDRDDPALPSLLGAALREELYWRFLFGLGSGPSELQVCAKFRIPPAEEIKDRMPGWSPSPDGYFPVQVLEHPRERAAGGELHVRSGVIMLDIENPHSTLLHVAALSVSEDRGRVLMRFEGSREQTAELPPKARVSLPCMVGVPGSWKLDRPMRDRYLVITSSQKFDPSGNERRPTLRAGQGHGSGPPAPLRLELGQDRGSSPPAYGLTVLDLLVTRR